MDDQNPPSPMISQPTTPTARELRQLEAQIGEGLKPPCPVCKNTLKVSKKQAGESGAFGYPYSCSTEGCSLLNGFAFKPWYLALIQTLQKRLSQLVVTAAASVTLTSVVCWSTGLFSRNPVVAPDSPDIKTTVYQKGADAFPEVGRMFTEARNGDVITCAGLNFHITANDRDDEILSALRRGVDVRFLIAPPTMEFCVAHAERHGHDAHRLLAEAEQGLESLRELATKAHAGRASGSSQGSLDVRIGKRQPLRRVYHLAAGERSRAVVVPFLDGIRSTDSPAFFFHEGNQLCEVQKSSLDSVWKEGTPLADWDVARVPPPPLQPLPRLVNALVKALPMLALWGEGLYSVAMSSTKR